MDMRPAARLEGLTLNGGWYVVKRIDRQVGSTGGHFSCGYKVRNEEGKEAYLKALDFSKALQAPDAARALEAMTKAYNFERDLLARCKEGRMSKVVIPLADGSVDAQGVMGELKRVQYLIFEMADGDIRSYTKHSAQIDLAWILRSLHSAAVGLKQLHGGGIAHQDLKPSNVLIFQQSQTKVSDLGRASHQTIRSENDEFWAAGDNNYCAPEQYYGYQFTGEFERRLAVDLYHLGSLIFFYFADVSASQAIAAKLNALSNPNLSGDNFINDLPYLTQAFHEAVSDLEKSIEKIAGLLTPDIMEIVLQLCEPDPKRRGHPQDRVGQPYNLERYISRLDLLARKAEYLL